MTVPLSLSFFFRIIASYFCLLLFIGQSMMLLFVNWNGNILFDLLYARIYGPFDYLSHGSSLLAICIAGVILFARTKLSTKTIPIAFLLVFDVSSIHESIYNLAYTGVPWYSPLIPKSAGLFIVELALLVISAKVFSTSEKFNLLLIFFFLVPFYALIAFFQIPITINGNVLSSAAYDPLPNILEVFGWIVPALILIFGVRKIGV